MKTPTGYAPLLLFCVLIAASPTAQAAAILYNGNDYFLTSTAESWTAAEAEAEADGGFLASIHSAADETFIIEDFLDVQTSPDPLWIGLVDPDTSDGSGTQHAADFVWSDGTAVNYTNWQSGEPNNANNSEYFTALNWHYAATGDASDLGTWNDTPLDGTTGYGGTSDGPYFGIIEVSAAPEPSTIALSLIGAAALALRRRRVR